MDENRDDSVCLVVIYNHNFERNISIVNRIYRERFQHVYHIMPFYRGTDPHVIGVYENSFQFSGYIAQAYEKLSNVRCSHYLFVADDMVINPNLSEQTALQILKLDDDANFICRIGLITNKMVRTWTHALTAAIFVNASGNACEWRQFLPTIEDARKQFATCGLDWQKGVKKRFVNWFGPWVIPMKSTPEDFFPLPGMRLLMKLSALIKDKSEPAYPMAFGYSDFFVVSRSSFSGFSHYCGILAAMRVHVEVAIPTALVLSSNRIRTAKEVGLSYIDGVLDYSLRNKIEQNYEFSYKRLTTDFRPSQLLYHPVKLSKWKDLP